MSYSSVAEYLRDRIREPLRKLAEYLGTTEVTISRARSGRQNLSASKLAKVARYFNDDVRALLRLGGFDAEAEAIELAASELPHGKFRSAAGQTASVPVVGYVSAGEVSLAYEYSDQGFAAGASDEHLALGGIGDSDYGLRIEGDSMEPAFPHGSRIVVSPEGAFVPGKLCVVRAVDGRCWVKIVIQRAGAYTLKSINMDYPPIYLGKDEVKWIHAVNWVKLP